MSFESTRNMTVVGNLVADPTERKRDGKVSASLKVAENERVRDPETGEWSNGDSRFWSVLVNGPAARNVLESLHKGDEVVIVGDAKMSYNVSDDGDVFLNYDMYASQVGASLRWSTAELTKAARSQSSNGSGAKAKPVAKAKPKPAKAEDSFDDDDDDDNF